MQFYDVLEQSKYQIKVSKPETVDQLSDLFITEEELQAIVGRHFHFYGKEPRSFVLREVISAELGKWAEKLDASGRKTLIIEDDELLDVMKDKCLYMTDFFDGDDTYGRHGDRICYARRYKRKKTKPTKGDVRDLWSHFIYAWYKKFDCYPPHIPLYDRHLKQFLAFKKILGWRIVRAQMYDKDRVKWFRQIWDNPEEYVS